MALVSRTQKLVVYDPGNGTYPKTASSSRSNPASSGILAPPDSNWSGDFGSTTPPTHGTKSVGAALTSAAAGAARRQAGTSAAA